MIYKVINIILMTIISVALVLPFGLFILKELEKTNRIKAEEMLWQEKLAGKKAKKQLSSLEQEKNQIQKKLTESKKEAGSLESELAGHKRQLASTRQKITGVDNKVISTERKINELNSYIKDIKPRIVNVTHDSLKLTEELTLLQKTTEALKGRLAQFLEEKKGKKKISAREPDLAKPQADISGRTPQAIPEPSLIGEVLIVNREFDFVVINLGQDDGIEEDMVLDISRDDNILAQVEVETVRTNTSAAGIIDKDAISQIRAGDKALLYPVR